MKRLYSSFDTTKRLPLPADGTEGIFKKGWMQTEEQILSVMNFVMPAAEVLKKAKEAICIEEMVPNQIVKKRDKEW